MVPTVCTSQNCSMLFELTGRQGGLQGVAWTPRSLFTSTQSAGTSTHCNHRCYVCRRDHPSVLPCMRCRRNGTRAQGSSGGAGTVSPAWPGLRRRMDLAGSCTFVTAVPSRRCVCATCRCSTLVPGQRVAWSPRGVCMHAPCNVCSDRMPQLQKKLSNRRPRQVS